MNINPVIVQHVFLSLIQVIVATALFFSFIRWGIREGDSWLQGLRGVEPSQEDQKFVAIDDPTTEKKLKAQPRLAAQMREIRARAASHMRLSTYYTTRTYACITTSAITAVAAGVLLAVGAVKGLEHAHPLLLNGIAVTSGLFVLFRALPMMFQHKKNIPENLRLYLELVNLQNAIMTYVETGLNSKGKKASLANFIHSVDKRMTELNELHAAFEQAGVPKPADVTKVIK